MINNQRNFVTLHQKYSDMKLERVVINKFWGKYNLDLHLDPDVNILTGANGSGKTTILDIIAALLANKTDLYCHHMYDNAVLYFSGNAIIKSITEGEKKKLSYIVNDNETTYDLFGEDLAYSAVSTFDSPIMSIEAIQKMKEKHSWLTSDLDFELYDVVNDYYKFQVSRFSQTLKNGDSPDMKEMGKLVSVLKDFRKITNELFAPKKIFNDQEGEVYFTLNNEEKTKIPLGKLSSGEKQLLILLLSTVAQDKEDFITFWDEPEVSLHIEWQRKLIRVIRQLNPNMQLIIATHSPSILFEGWENRVLNIEELLEQ